MADTRSSHRPEGTPDITKTDAKSGLFWSAVNTWTGNFLSFAIFVVLARLVAPDELGLLAIATIFIALGQILLNDTVSFSLVQRPSLEDDHLDTAFWAMFGLGVLFCCIEILAAPLASRIFSEPRLTLILQVFSVRLVLDSLLVVPQGILLKRLDFKSLAIRTLVANIAGGIVGIGLAAIGAGVWALVLQQLTNALLTSATCWLRVGWRPRFVFSIDHGRQLLSFSAHTMLLRTFVFLGLNSDRAIIGHLIGPAALGFYYVARRTETLVEQSLAGVVNAVSFPLFANKQHDREELASSMVTAASLSNLITIPAFAGLAIVAPDLLPIVYGPKWLPSTTILQILAIGGIFAAADGVHEAAIRAVGRASWLSITTLIWSSLTVIGFVAASPYGLPALATSFVAVTAITFPIYFWMIARLLPMNMGDYLRTYIAPFAAAVLMVGAVVLFQAVIPAGRMSHVLRLGLEILIGAAVYLTVIYVFAHSRLMQLLKYLSVLRKKRTA